MLLSHGAFWASLLVLVAAFASAVVLLARLLRSKQSETSWAKFPEDNPLPVLRLTPGGQVQYANQAGRAFLAELGGPRGLRLPAELIQTMTQSQAEGKPRDLLLPVGRRIWMTLTIPLKGEEFVHLYCREVTETERSRQRLAQSEANYRTLFNAAQDALLIHDAESGAVLDVNQRMLDMFGYEPSEIASLDLGRISLGQAPYDLEHANQHIHKAAQGEPQTFDWQCRAKDGRVFWVEVNLKRVELGGEARVLANLRDITRRRGYEYRLKLAASFFENAAEGIMVTNSEGIIEMINPGFSVITGYSAEEAVGSKPRLLRSHRHSQEFYSDLWHQLLNQGKWQGEIWNRRKNGEAYPQRMSITAIQDHEGRVLRYLAVFHDISDVKRDQESIQRQAYHDPLTGLANRLLLMDRIEMALARARRQGNMVAVIFSDLDGFKKINDTLGHAAGDSLLIQVAQRLGQTLRGEDTVARVGGDEFVMVLPGINHANYAAIAARRVIKRFSEPFDLDGREVTVRTSLGISLFPGDGDDPEGLLRSADKAMYQAKAGGGDRYVFWKDLQTGDQQRESNLRLA